MALQVLTRFPTPATTAAARGTYVFVGATNDVGGINPASLRLLVNGQVAYADGAFDRPVYDGEVLLTNNYAAIRVQPRREFDPGQAVEIVLDLTDDQFPPVSTLHDVFGFTVATEPPTLVNAAVLAPCQLRFVTAYPDAYLDAFRQLLGTGLSPDPRLVTSVAAYRLEQSSARPLGVPLQLPPPLDLLARDLAPLMPLDAQLQALLPLWDGALTGLRALGVGPQTIETLRRAMASGYPQNRVGAACGATLLAGAFYAAQGL